MKKSIFLFFAAILCAMTANAATVTSDGTARLYFKMSAVSWWIAGNNGDGNFAYFYNNSTGKNAWSAHAVKYSGNDYYVTIPEGSWAGVILTRNNTSTAPSWDNKWNQTGDITLKDDKNYISSFSEGSTSVTWSTQKPTSTVSVTATPANALVGEEVSLSSALTSNTSINTSNSATYSANGGTVNGNKFTASEAGTYTITTNVTYYPNCYSKITSTATATTTVVVTSAEEPKHNVTVSWKCGETELQASQTLSVSESTANTAEAPEFKDYTFSGWELGSGVESVDKTANPISITTKASGDYTLTAKYTYIEPVMKTIYCKMEYNWWTQSSAAISAFISGTYGESATSLGTLMTLAPLEGNVWKIDVDVARYQKIRFIRVNPEGTSDWNARTGLVEIPTDDKNLYTITQSTDKWSGDCPGTWSVYEAPAAAPTRYITGSKELVGGEGWKANEVEMTYDNALSIYSHTFSASALTTGTEYKLKVTDGTWGNHWGAINGTIEGVSNDADGNVCFKLSTVGDVTVTFDGAKVTLSTTGAFYVPVVYDYYIVGSMNSWAQNNEDYGMSKVGETTTYSKELTLAAGTYEFKVKGNSWYGYTDIVGEYEEISEGKDGEGNPNGNVQLKLTASKTFTVNFDSNTKKITFTDLTEIIPTYTVAGDSEAAFGTTWDPTNTANDMALEGGLYKWTKTNVALYANTKISFKVVKNHDWNKGQWPERDGENDNNWILQDGIAADGLYTITITFNESTKEIQATATKNGDIVIKDFSNQPATLYFHPSFHWTSDAAQFAAYFYNNGPGADATPTWVNMTDGNGDGIYEVANAKQHEYVIICRMNPARTENNWDEDKTWNQIESGITIPNTAGDLNTCLAFWTNCQGDVSTSECTWVAPIPLTDKNWDAFVAAYNGQPINAVVERSFKSGQYHTLCLPFDIPTDWLGEGTEAYQLTSIVANNTGDKLSLNATSWNTIEAGQPYIIKPVKGSEYEHVIINGVTVKNVSAGTNIASGDGYNATLKAVTATDGTKTNGSTEYYVGANDGKLYNAEVDKLGLRAIIELTTTGGQPLPAKVRAYVAAEENEATGFENIVAPEGQALKVIENGQLIIIRNGEKFNAQGQKL